MSAPDPKKFRLNMFLPLVALALIAVFAMYVVRNNYASHKNVPAMDHPDRNRHVFEKEAHHGETKTEHHENKVDSTHH